MLRLHLTTDTLANQLQATPYQFAIIFTFEFAQLAYITYLLHIVQNGSIHLSKCVHSNTFWSESVLLILVNNTESGVV